MRALAALRSLPLACALAAAEIASPRATADEAALAMAGARLYIDTETPEYRRFVIDGRPGADYIQRILERLDPRERRGVIVHLQGCPYGPSRMAAHSQARFMASLGYVVLVADPLPGETAPDRCRAAEGGDGATSLHGARRQQLDRLIGLAVALPWADSQRVFASGFGEGGDAVLDHRHPAVRGRIAIAPRCRFGIDRQPVPTLLIASRQDRWYAAIEDAGARLRCARAAAWPYADLFEAEGSLHDALVYGESRVVLSHFLVRAGYQHAAPP